VGAREKGDEVMPGPWLLGGDLNEVSNDRELSHGRTREPYLFESFRHLLEDCELVDLGFVGAEFTWRRSSQPDSIEERLDRCLATPDWGALYPKTKVHHLEYWNSDHRPLLLLTNGRREKRGRTRGKRFFFKEAWCDEEECGEHIRGAWEAASGEDDIPTIIESLGRCKNSLESWGSGKKRTLAKRILRQKDLVRKIGDGDMGGSRSDLKREQHQLDALLEKEERFWRQRSQLGWMKCGDKNTSLFHRKASARKKRNSIIGLFDGNGVWREGELGVEEVITDYFNEIFSSSSLSPESIESALTGVDAVVSPEMNTELLRPFDEDDVKTTLFSMSPIKAPGRDGFPALFYQKIWGIVGDRVTKACLGILNHGQPISEINDTILTLIPKVDKADKFSDFRPISLCNVMYKIVSRCLVWRMKGFMEKIISENQWAFVGGRQIFDNVMVCFEGIHTMKRGRFSNEGCAALKIDMAKAYDRVEWSFLEAMMRKLGFDEGWVEKIMRCITSVSFSFNINGSTRGRVIPKRGLRQGDPLSPFLFLFCSDGLSSLLRNGERNGSITGVRFGRENIRVSHLLFTDDSLIFFRACVEEASAIVDCLDTYATASGQLINLAKSDVCFGKEIEEEAKGEIAATLRVNVTTCHKRYLGLPTVTGRRKKEVFAFVKERIWEKIKSWRGIRFSQAGREVLIKSILQTIPSYAASVFRLPETLIADIHKAVAKFLWGNCDEKKTHWCK
jgi:hypothetical protein